MRKKLQKVFAILLTLSMLLSMMSITAFASGLTAQQEANKEAQVVYAGEREEVVADKVWMTKTAETTDTEGKFKVTLQVETKDKIQQVTSAEEPTIDVVLVMDESGSMSDNNRMKNAKEAATEFVNTFLGVSPNGKRQVAVVSYEGTATNRSEGLSNDLVALRGTPYQDYWGQTKYYGGAINNMRAEGGTNIQAGLKAARDILSTSSAQYKYVVLLSDGEPTYYYQATDEQTAIAKNNFIAESNKNKTYQQNYVNKAFDYTTVKGTGYAGSATENHVYNTVSEARY